LRIQRGRAHSACACFQRSRRVVGSVSVDKLIDTAHHIGSIERAHGRKFDPGRMELLIRKNPGCECPRTVGVAITDKNGFLDAFHNSRPASSSKAQNCTIPYPQKRCGGAKTRRASPLTTRVAKPLNHVVWLIGRLNSNPQQRLAPTVAPESSCVKLVESV